MLVQNNGMFTIEDVEDAISQTSFEKGILIDRFYGKIVRNREVRLKVKNFILKFMNKS